MGAARTEGGRREGWKRLLVLLAALGLALVPLAMFASGAAALSPSVGSKAASNVDYSTATFNGTVNPNGLETKIHFEYGPTTSYGTKTAEVSVGSGGSVLERAQAISGLTPNTTYHYRIVATNADGTSAGGDRTFRVGWTVQAPAANSNISRFEDVSCPSAAECVAVGWNSTSNTYSALAQRWNGSEWKAQTLAQPASVLRGVSCPAVNACTAVGASGGSALVEVWNGSAWKVQSVPFASAVLEGVSCTSASECTAVGQKESQTFAMRWNGTEWKAQATPNPASNNLEVNSVSCPTSTFCMAVGWYWDAANNKAIPFSMRWNGSEWMLKNGAQPAGSTMSWFYDVSCTSSSACMAVGDKEVSAATHEHQTMAQRWSGSEWLLQTTPNPEATNRLLSGISCTSSSACTAVGSYIASGVGSPMALQWDGSSWTLRALPSPSGSTTNERSPMSVSCVASRGCEAVGEYRNGSGARVLLAEGSWRPAMPTVTTVAATSVGEKSATLNGTANPNGSETKVYFEYGTSTLYGSKTAEINLGAGTGAAEASVPLSGLNPATTYHYRIVGNNENPATSRGSDQTFRTQGPPTVSNFGADVDNATGEAATLTGSVNPNGLSTTYQFEYGASPGVYTSTVPASPESAGSGTAVKAATYKITGLTRGKTYYYRLTATNSAGKTNSSEEAFTTPNVPGATTGAASEATRKCAKLTGTVQPNGLATKYWFEYGKPPAYGSKIPVTAKEVAGFVSSQAVEETACGLAAGTLYHYRLVAGNGLGTTIASDQTFTTLPAVTLRAKGLPLGTGTPLKAFSSNLTFSVPGWTYACAETEFAGTVSENPGAVQSVSTAKLQNSGGAACALPGFPSGTVKFTVPAQAMSIEYTIDKSGQGTVRTSSFTFNVTYTFGAFKVGECEYGLQLSGAYMLKAPLTTSLTGETKLIKTLSGECPTGKVSGAFAVSSSGNPVEAT